MRIPRIFIDQPLESGADVALPAATSHYLSRVLRLEKNAALVLFNGQGGEYKAQLTTSVKRNSVVTIGAHIDRDCQSPLKIQLGVGMSRGERMDLIIQKATELGVDSIIPLFTERCEIKLSGERTAKRLSHWRKISISACEQSGRTLLPEIYPPETAAAWLARTEADIKLVLEPTAPQGLPTGSLPVSAALFSGPEGGLTESEVSFAKHYGFRSVSLGPRILRTETAPVAVLSILQYLWGDMQLC